MKAREDAEGFTSQGRGDGVYNPNLMNIQVLNIMNGTLL
jgi:hypothetical protein